jgi:nucleotide-binding universal stress UspA family protein
MKILLAVDGSKNSLDAVDCVISHADWYRETPKVELLTVHLPVPKLPNLGKVVSKAQIEKFYQEDGEAWLAMAKKKLDLARIPYEARILVGQPAETIVKHAKDSRCDLICIGTRGMTELGKLLLGSTATRVLHISTVPVLLVK